MFKQNISSIFNVSRSVNLKQSICLKVKPESKSRFPYLQPSLYDDPARGAFTIMLRKLCSTVLFISMYLYIFHFIFTFLLCVLTIHTIRIIHRTLHTQRFSKHYVRSFNLHFAFFYVLEGLIEKQSLKEQILRETLSKKSLWGHFWCLSGV